MKIYWSNSRILNSQGRHSPQGMEGGSWGNCGGVETRAGLPREELKTPWMAPHGQGSLGPKIWSREGKLLPQATWKKLQFMSVRDYLENSVILSLGDRFWIHFASQCHKATHALKIHHCYILDLCGVFLNATLVGTSFVWSVIYSLWIFRQDKAVYIIVNVQNLYLVFRFTKHGIGKNPRERQVLEDVESMSFWDILIRKQDFNHVPCPNADLALLSQTLCMCSI